MGNELEKKKKDTIWVAKNLFQRNKVSGSSANISFRDGDKVYISATNTCFGTLEEEDFSVLDLDGKHLDGPKPSKEFPLHLFMYSKDSRNGAVIHTHSFYSTLWSCLKHEDKRDLIPSHTPYLDMKLGKITLVEYAAPGTKELFDNFCSAMNEGNGYLLKNHGPIVAAEDVLKAFYALEELEESSKIAWHLRNERI
ncbi:class II aldolase/adducin family protein [Alkalibacter mobilis]|uniref:class II aldolase/adducin family protein n=1 Tax=Alkalibacter mobilis TaxID=2787712 RepID=UPI001A9AD6DE|nr:class II aldolase/adducin family protein [Alkalibacter mobilis]